MDQCVLQTHIFINLPFFYESFFFSDKNFYWQLISSQHILMLSVKALQ